MTDHKRLSCSHFLFFPLTTSLFFSFLSISIIFSIHRHLHRLRPLLYSKRSIKIRNIIIPINEKRDIGCFYLLEWISTLQKSAPPYPQPFLSTSCSENSSTRWSPGHKKGVAEAQEAVEWISNPKNILFGRLFCDEDEQAPTPFLRVNEHTLTLKKCIKLSFKT